MHLSVKTGKDFLPGADFEVPAQTTSPSAKICMHIAGIKFVNFAAGKQGGA